MDENRLTNDTTEKNKSKALADGLMLFFDFKLDFDLDLTPDRQDEVGVCR